MAQKLQNSVDDYVVSFSDAACCRNPEARSRPRDILCFREHRGLHILMILKGYKKRNGIRRSFQLAVLLSAVFHLCGFKFYT